MDIVIDANNCIAGRTASIAAKQLLKGNRVSIINAEKAVVSGNPKHTEEVFRAKRTRGDRYKGPFYPQLPDRILKRMVRGMLPHGRPKGKEVYHHLRVYLAVPEELEGKPVVKGVENTLRQKFITLEELSKQI